MKLSRSRKGAWIEICINIFLRPVVDSRSRKGAWIEIHGLKTTFDSGYLSLP